MENNKNNFIFLISLSILDHLGRNLYRNFITILGEAISNSWDADAKNVWIYINENSFFIKDDGIGMDETDFQEKFLKVGYSKRKENNTSPSGRPYIGRKGIGKLALLSCAEKITIASKKDAGDYVGGVIHNPTLDEVIKNDLTPDSYPLGDLDINIFGSLTDNHQKGTIIYFEDIKDGIKNTLEFLKKVTALYFRFSLIDDSFNIYINDQKITLQDIKDLSDKTEFLWVLNDFSDLYLSENLNHIQGNSRNTLHLGDDNIQGFIASVKTPKNLSILSTGERVSIDLFVNGRLRERDILKNTPTARIAESYLYGQIHYNILDQGEDKFTSSREGVVADDPEYKEFLSKIKRTVSDIVNHWDQLRIDNREDGDPENERISQKERKSRALVSVVSKEYVPTNGESIARINGWLKNLDDDAQYNVSSYTECFISENLVRNFIKDKNIDPKTEQAEITKWRNTEARDKRKGNITIDIRNSDDDLYYLGMETLVKLAQPPNDGHPDTLNTDEKQFTPIRNAVMHTSRLTDEAKRKLTTVFDSIKSKIKVFLS